MKQSENGQSAAKLEWRIIAEDTNYMISNTGLVKRIQTNHILSFGNKKRYYTVALHSNGVRKDRYVHRLVALAFLPNPNNLPYVNHLDHNIHNNKVENLEWCTTSENARHSYESGRRVIEYQMVRKGIQRKMTDKVKKPVVQYDLDMNYIASFESAAEAARQTNVNNRGISFVCKGKRKTAGGFIWRFQEGSTTKRSENPTETARDSETRDDIV